jgi:hypothetical protein
MPADTEYGGIRAELEAAGKLIDALAEAASRSAFAARFRTSVGEPPNSYLTR